MGSGVYDIFQFTRKFPPSRGVQLSLKSTRSPDCSWANSYSNGYRFIFFYIFLGFGRVMDYFFFVKYPPNPLDTYIKIKSNPILISFFSLSHIFFTPPSLPTSFAPTPPSRHHSFTASLRQSLTSQLTPSQHRFVNLTSWLTPTDPSLPHDLIVGFLV